MSLNGAGLFLLSLIFLSFFYILFNSDIFISSALSGFPSLVTYRSDGGYSPTFAGELLILTLVLVFYSVSYILIINLD
jgi:hypothetical protein